ncbi:MAG: hypothetical protein E7618_04820 [Ruminococcaceae bacterium]|nr:hypothetical protein [Oscillospiraceae bacterium]
MKKLIPLLCLSLALLLCACNPLSLLVNTELTETHTIPNYGLTVRTPSDWKPIEDTEFDLYLGTDSESVYFGVFAYFDSELEGVAHADLFAEKNSMMMEDSTDTKVTRAEKKETLTDRTITTIVCEGEEEDLEYACYFAMIEFDGVTVWLYASTGTAFIDYYLDAFDEIVKTMTLTAAN